MPVFQHHNLPLRSACSFAVLILLVGDEEAVKSSPQNGSIDIVSLRDADAWALIAKVEQWRMATSGFPCAPTNRTAGIAADDWLCRQPIIGLTMQG